MFQMFHHHHTSPPFKNNFGASLNFSVLDLCRVRKLTVGMGRGEEMHLKKKKN